MTSYILQRPKVYTAHVADLVIKGTPTDIIKRCEGEAYRAMREKREVVAHTFFQTAEHYKKVSNHE